MGRLRRPGATDKNAINAAFLDSGGAFVQQIQKHHMTIHWHSLAGHDNNGPAISAPLDEKATLVGRIGLMMLSVGTAAWRVRESMNTASRALGITSSADIGLLNITLTCIDGSQSITETLSLRTTGVNTRKLMALELFLRVFEENVPACSVDQFHTILDDIEKKQYGYPALQLGLSAGLACASFTFLLGGGLPEMLCAFFGAAMGQFIRKKLLERRVTLFAVIAVSVAAACFVYAGTVKGAELLFHPASVREAGYICSMLFVIPGFPLITGGIDLAKLDLRSGSERIMYALLIILTATMTGWAMAMLAGLAPSDLVEPDLGPAALILLRMAASFCGVYGFSLMFNSTGQMAVTAGFIGMIANSIRLVLVDYSSVPFAAAAFLGANAAGILASVIKKHVGYPRISLTVPSIVIMVPGLFMYRGIFNLGLTNIGEGALWLTKAFLITISLPMGLVAARICTDQRFRKSS